MNKILVSACLLGAPVRYDGRALPLTEKDQILARWTRQGRVVPVCPEVDAGMPVPRPPAEIVDGTAAGVLASTARVVDINGQDVSSFFLRGARLALDLCREHEISIALLTESSPSCGSSRVSDGSFSGVKIPGAGVTSTLLEKHGIRVFSQNDIALADRLLSSSAG